MASGLSTTSILTSSCSCCFGQCPQRRGCSWLHAHSIWQVWEEGKRECGRAAGLDRARSLDSADVGAFLSYDAVGEFGVITAHWQGCYGSVVAAGRATGPPTMTYAALTLTITSNTRLWRSLIARFTRANPSSHTDPSTQSEITQRYTTDTPTTLPTA